MIRQIFAAAGIAFIAAGCTTAADTTATADKNMEAAHKMHEMRPHIVKTQSNNDFETTLAKLLAAVDNRGFKLFAVVDHAKGAASVDQPLRPTTLVIFGNPKGGTPLLQAEQTIGIELPLRALVYQTEDSVMIATTDIKHALHEFGVGGKDDLQTKIAGALQAIADEAAQ